uniref:Cadherin-5 n=1 Tax=Mastacembelus armatus TaxID=205130 RepID=A0A7N8YLK3_9TELE
MACVHLWTMGLMATMVLSISLATAEDSGLPVVEGQKQSPVEIVKKESHPILSRQKRDWIWNSLYVEEEKPAPIAYKIGQVCFLSPNGEGANTIFTVDDKGDLFVTRSLDREEKNAYHLTARMYDGNDKLIEDSGHFVVQVTDLNDNKPIFPRTYNGSIMERSMIGTKVVEVRATDADDPTTANGELSYSLTPDGDLSSFEIDRVTGVISCKTQTLDRETRSQYVVVVKAQDMRGRDYGNSATTSVTITIIDTNDNIASFTQKRYELKVPENHKLDERIGTLELVDRDQIHNKQPIFNISREYSKMFSVKLNPNKDGNLMLNEALDYEKKNSYTFDVKVRENLINLHSPPDNINSAVTTAQVTIEVLDVDEPPVFSQSKYTFSLVEEQIVKNIGTVTAKDPDKANKNIRYSISEKDCPIGINPSTGQLFSLRTIDREEESRLLFHVKAQEHPSGLESFVKVNITVQDINDNKPELRVNEIYVCEDDSTDTVIGTLEATDKDEHSNTFTFSLYSSSSNFSIRNHGSESLCALSIYLPFFSCRCDARRIIKKCKADARRMGVSVHALIAILLCILTILVIVILFVMRKRYQKDSLANMKNSGEIHEQLVTYDEEGGGEMDTNGYDVSILSSACHDGSLLRHPEHRPHPSLYAMVQKPPHHAQPTACKGDMAAMIEVKKDEADHDRDGIPYDTLHIYGYEGPESLAGSLSSLESSSSGSNVDYDFLNDWGPRFRTLAELYGVDGSDYYHEY